MAANFWNNLWCCNTDFGDLQELHRHYEEVDEYCESVEGPPLGHLPNTGFQSANVDQNQSCQPQIMYEVQGSQPTWVYTDPNHRPADLSHFQFTPEVPSALLGGLTSQRCHTLSLSNPSSLETTDDIRSPGFPAQGLQFGVQRPDYNAQLVQTNDLMGLNRRSEFGTRNMCVDDPAQTLFTENDIQRLPHVGFRGIPIDSEEPARRSSAYHSLASPIEINPEEDRPFKCPVIGCEKLYKNVNGLRYHEKHGHANQQLKENNNGSFSIVDPRTHLPYPGNEGMAIQKPYRCNACGKRYKNRNGLKYHRNHPVPSKINSNSMVCAS